MPGPSTSRASDVDDEYSEDDEDDEDDDYMGPASKPFIPSNALRPSSSTPRQPVSMARPASSGPPVAPAGVNSRYLQRDANGNVTHKFYSKEFHNYEGPGHKRYNNKLKPIADFDLKADGNWEGQCRRCNTVARNRRR